jgi:hypothetical protein
MEYSRNGAVEKPRLNGQRKSIRILPLWEFMKSIEITAFFSIGAYLQGLKDQARIAKGDALISASEESITTNILAMEAHMRFVDAYQTLELTEHARTKIKNGTTTWKEALALFECIEIAARTELKEIFVGYIPTENAKYWGKEKPFGKQVHLTFPSVIEEVNSACNCYAVEEYTAAVFHLMRVAELGLRALARQNRIKIKNRTLEYADWQDVINGLTKRVTIFENRKRGRAREAALAFYKGAIADCSYFKEAYRHPLMHSRSGHVGPETLVIMTRVSEFMQALAKNRVHE